MKTALTLLLVTLSLQSIAQQAEQKIIDTKMEPVSDILIQLCERSVLKVNVSSYSGNYMRYAVVPERIETLMPIVTLGNKSEIHVLTREEIATVPASEVTDLISFGEGGAFNRNRGSDVNIGGRGATYVIDGNPIPVVMVSDNGSGPELSKCWCRSPTDYVFTREELSKLPISDLYDAISLLPGIYQARRGDDLNIFGARSQGTQYIVDGERMR